MIDIKQAAADDVWQKEPLTWRGLKLTDGSRSATVSCSNGHSGSLEHHDIAADGTVSSLECPEDGCDFHDHVKLQGWTP